MAESTSQATLEPVQELLTVHGTTQGESSDAVSIYTASTSVSGNGKFMLLVLHKFLCDIYWIYIYFKFIHIDNQCTSILFFRIKFK